MTYIYRATDNGELWLEDSDQGAEFSRDGRVFELEGETYEPDQGMWGGNGWAEPEPSGGASTQKGYMISQSLPFNWPYAKMAGASYDERRRPVFTSMTQQKEALRIAQSHGEPVVYDP